MGVTEYYEDKVISSIKILGRAIEKLEDTSKFIEGACEQIADLMEHDSFGKLPFDTKEVLTTVFNVIREKSLFLDTYNTEELRPLMNNFKVYFFDKIKKY